MRSRSIILTGPQQVELQQQDVSEPGPGELLVQSHVSLISTGTECICFRGDFEEGTHWAGWVKYPFSLGYSSVGRVVAIGSGVENFTAGDRVFAVRPHHEFYHVPADPDFVNRIADAITDEQAAWSKLATIGQTAVRRADIKPGDNAVVIGQGPLGQIVAQYLRALGAESVMVIDPLQARLDIAKRNGMTLTFVGTAEDALQFVEDHTDGQLGDAVFDVTGHYSVFSTALQLARQFGTVMLVGDSPHPHKQHLASDVITRQLQIRGTHNEQLPPDQSRWTRDRQTQLFYRYVEDKRMSVDNLISARHKPEAAGTVYPDLLADRSGTLGVLFDWSS